MKLVLLAGLLGLGLSGTAYAQELACPTETADLRQVLPGDDPSEFFAGLQVSFLLGLDPATFPADSIAEEVDPCTRGQFTVNGATYTVFGDDRTSPPRWAASPDQDAIAFLALMPPPATALKWARSRNRSNSMSFDEPPIYAVVVTESDQRLVYAILAEVPGDEVLNTLLRQTLDGTLKPFARYDASSGKTEPLAQ